MRNLVVCCDGTWNTPEQRDEGVPVPTNVVRLYNAVAGQDGAGREQLRYYHPGVGSEGNWWERLAGGGAGVGLTRTVLSAYRWLGGAYRDGADGGDRLFLYGFSRGAYTVRSLAGMIGRCGLLDLSDLDEGEVWRRVERAFKQGYRRGRSSSVWADAAWRFHRPVAADSPFPIHFIGVWDTVGALGIPDDLTLLNLLDDPKKYAFHATDLGGGVSHARHALALDEVRASFSPTLWTDIAPDRDVRQVWFPGVHADVGGGYREVGLSDCALQWMVEESKALGLGFSDDMMAQLRPDPRGVLHDSRTGLFRMLRSQPRSCPAIGSGDGAISVAAAERQENPPIAQAPYHPTTVLAAGDERRFSIFAAQPWNETGLYLEAGVPYELTATGQWVDRTIKCGPDGATAGRFKIGELAHLAGSLWGRVEEGFKRLTKNEQADFRGTKRVESLPWFALVGVVVNGGNPGADGTPAPHELIPIKAGCTHTPARSGYLYAFANDAWHFYGNNHGSVSLTVRRRS